MHVRQHISVGGFVKLEVPGKQRLELALRHRTTSEREPRRDMTAGRAYQARTMVAILPMAVRFSMISMIRSKVSSLS